jgi:Ca-activated chloride channel family protein
VGLGLDYNEDLMEALAENGRGNYHYAAQAAALEPIFTAEFRSLQATVAQNVELRLTPLCDGTEVSEVLGHDSHRDGRTLVVPLTDLAGADQRRLLVRLRAADGGPARTAGRTGRVTVQLAYTDASTGRRVDSQVGLAVELTDDPALAERGIDRDVMEQVLAVHSARRLREASEAYQRGEVAQAQQVLAETRSTIAENAMRYKLSTQFARAADAELAEVNAGVAAFAPASPEGKQLIKGSKAAARDKAKKR